MLNLFKIKFGKSMIVSFTIQQVLVAASSWVLVNFIHQTAALKNFQISNIIVLILVAISPYIPGFIANYFYNLWVVFARTDNTHRFIKLIDGQKNWVFDSKKRDEVFALQRENASLIDETSRFFYLNFPVILNLIFNSVAIGFLLGTDITLGMLGGLAISSLQFFLIPRFTQKIQKENQETQYESEKRFLGFWQVLLFRINRSIKTQIGKFPIVCKRQKGFRSKSINLKPLPTLLFYSCLLSHLPLSYFLNLTTINLIKFF